LSAVLVTGGSGFIGVPVLRELARREHVVHALHCRSAPVDISGVRWHRVDLAAPAELDAIVAELRPQELIHLAWYVKHGRFWDAPENVPWVERSLHLMRAFARAGGRRAVMLGTCAEYDWSAADAPLSERSSPLGPATLYGVAKDALRRLASKYAEQVGFEFAWGRLFFLYGPNEAPGRLVASVASSLLRGEPAETSSGTQRRDFLHVDDVARAVGALLDSSVQGPVNIASGEDQKLADVVECIAQTVGRPELLRIGALADRPGEPPRLVGDTRRLREEVEFRPAKDLHTGIAETVGWWRDKLSDSK
jgi:nucleoside-diphosphate-sugar epimerase